MILIGIDVLLIHLILTNQTQVRAKPLLFASIFFIWSVVVTATRYDISTYIFTMLGLIVMWIPLLVKVSISESDKLLVLSKWYCRGLSLSFIFAYQDVISSLFSLPRTEEFIPFAVAQRTSFVDASLNIGIERVNSLMTEPSEYAAFLVFGYICLDYLNKQNSINKSKIFILKLHTIFFLFFTFSLSGFFLFFSYLILNLFLDSSKITMKLLTKNIVFCLMIVFLFFVLINIIPDLNIAATLFFERVNSAIGIDTHNLNTSEGARFNSINVAFDSLFSNNGFIGQGFGNNIARWLIENYSNLSTEYARGDIFNIYAAVIIGVGIPGLLAFIGTIYQSFITNKINDKFQVKYFLIWILFGWTLGSLLYYTYWGAFYLVAIQGKSANKKSSVNISY